MSKAFNGEDAEASAGTPNDVNPAHARIHFQRLKVKMGSR